MNIREKDPEVYSILCYMLIFVGFYIIHRVFTLNDPDDEEEKINEHSN
jgi:hypothetical protein